MGTNGCKKEVWVFVFDVRSPNSPFESVKPDRRVGLLKKLRDESGLTPDFVSNGSMRSCGRDVVRRLYDRGFLNPMKDLAPMALGLDIEPPKVFQEMVRLTEEQKKGEKIKDVPI